ncbi:MAG: Ig-like domain-containing protein [Lachnospiraceae bacterium]|nr:Ig-like domain-containing protein [Lachnospiraceae bacterium]
MKSFFKKLAFVMALAMVVSMAAPAAQKAVAAEDKKPLAIAYQEGAAIKTLNLKNVGDEEDLRFLYAPANYKELGVTWSSSNPNVVSVDDNGLVKAEAEGNATISVAIGTETASIDVYCVNMKTFEATIGTPENREMETATIKVGDYIDFAFYGIEDYSANRYNCEWFPVDPEGCIEVCGFDTATPGLVTAKKAGTAKLTLAVINLKTMQRTDVKSVTITVPATEPEVTPAPAMEVLNTRTKTKVNKTQNTVELVFDKATDLKPENVTLFRIFTATDDEEGLGNNLVDDTRKGYEDFYVRGIKPNDNKTVWTVTTFEDFTDGVWYEARVVGFDNNEFQASVGPVDSVEVNATTAYLESAEGDLDLVPSYLSVALYDAKGVDVTTRVVDGVPNNDPSNIEFSLAEEEYEKFNLLNYNEIEFYSMATAKAMATYEANGVERTNATPALVTPKSRNEYGVKKVIDWTIVKKNTAPDWNATVKEVPAGEYDYYLVTLLEDTRGDYYATYYKGATANGGPKYNNKDVLWTEDDTKPFWLNGLFVEYKAMHMDTMLVETDGEIASYDEGKARFALYLYNQNLYSANEFQGELLSQYVNVCCERALKTFDTDKTALVVMKNTEEEYQHIYEGDPAVNTVEDAYYSEFSKAGLKVTLKDVHGDKADVEDAQTADFSITLTSETTNAALKALVEEDFEERLKNAFEDAIDDEKVEFSLNIEANDFIDDATGKYITSKSQVKFRITDATTKTTKNIVVNLVSLVEDKVTLTVDEDDDGKMDILYSDVDLIKEFVDAMKSDMYFEKFVVTNKKVNVEQSIADEAVTPVNSGSSVKLLQEDVKGNDIGYESDIWVANANIINHKINLADIITAANNNSDNDASGSVSVGDRVLVVTDKYGKVYPVVGDEYDNPAYDKKEIGFLAPVSTNNLGISVSEAKEATSASGAAVGINQYNFYFRTADQTGEIIYAKEGTYTAEIRTIESIVNDVVTFTKAVGLSDKVTLTVTNNNAKVTYASRDAVRYDDRSIYTYADDETVTRGIGSEE